MTDLAAQIDKSGSTGARGRNKANERIGLCAVHAIVATLAAIHLIQISRSRSRSIASGMRTIRIMHIQTRARAAAVDRRRQLSIAALGSPQTQRGARVAVGGADAAQKSRGTRRQGVLRAQRLDRVALALLT